jgi:hypothetical protein
MIKSNAFYLFLVGIFLTLSALSFYWFNNVDSYTDTHGAKENTLLQGSTNVWNKLNAILDFLDILGDNSQADSNDKDIYIFDNPIKKSAGVINSFEVNSLLEQENKEAQKKSTNYSIGDIMEEKEIKEKTWYQKSDNLISKTGFYAFKRDNNLELGWQSSKGKTYSINIPY